MSTPNNLPSIIIKNILQHATSHHAAFDIFHKNLKLLAICQSWREYAMPLVYNCVYFYLDCPFSNSFNCDINSRYTRKQAGQTNIGLIKALNVSHLVLNLKINVYKFPNFINYFMKDADAIFEFSHHSWKKINRVMINMPGFGEVYDEGEEQFDIKCQQKINSFVKKLYNEMPNVIDMNLLIDINDKHKFFAKELAAIYADQLVKCDTNSMDKTIEYCKITTKLQDALVYMNPVFLEQRNFLNTKVLRKLVIMSIDSITQLVNYLSEPSHSQSVTVYSNLKTLSLTFSSNISFDQTQISSLSLRSNTIEFPCLKSLKITTDYARECIDMLTSDYFTWPNVVSLEIVTDFCKDHILSTEETIMTLRHSINKLQMKLPNLSKVKLYKKWSTDTQYILLDCFTSALKDKVVHVPKIDTTLLDNIFFSRNLNQLKITANNDNAFLLIDYNKKSLTKLELLNVSNSFSWEKLNPNYNKIQQFNKLTFISLSYSFNQNNDKGHIYKLQCLSEQKLICFPKLDTTCFTQIYSDTAVKLLTDQAVDISNAKKLEIAFNSDPKNNWEKRACVSTSDIGCLIKKSMPNINILHIEDPSKNNLPLTDAISQQYSYQVDTIIIYTDNLENYKFSSKNDSLVISSSLRNLNQANNLIIHIDNLTFLKLNMSSYYFSWSWFKNQIVGSMPEFKKLEIFYIEYSSDENNKHIPSKQLNNVDEVTDLPTKMVDILLPSIKIINIDIPNNLLIPAPSKIYFNIINSVKLIGPVACLPICGNKETTVLDSQDICINCVTVKDEEYFYKFTNSWFGNRQPINECTLSILSMDISLDIGRIDWRFVDKLECHFKLDILIFYNLISQLPNASEIVADCLTIEDGQSIQGILEHNKNVEPLSTSIQTIEIGLANDNIDKTIKDKILNYTLLALPSLKHYSILNYTFDFLV